MPRLPRIAKRDEPASERLMTVSELTGQVRAVLANFGDVGLQGEISNLSQPSSGHVYFNLKDDRARSPRY